MSTIDLEALTDIVEAAIADDNHKDLCGCDRWPDSCPYFCKGHVFSAGAYAVLETAMPHIEAALVKRILDDAMFGDDETNPFHAALKVRTERVRETIARDIRAFAKEAAKTDEVPTILGLITAASIAEGKRFGSVDELADELDSVLAADIDDRLGAVMHHDAMTNEWVIICDECGELDRGDGESAAEHNRLAQVWAEHDRSAHDGDGSIPDGFLIREADEAGAR